MRSAVGVPPGSFVTSGFVVIEFSSSAATRRSCVVLPQPSLPSKGMNMVAGLLGRRVPSNLATLQPFAQSPQVMLPHQSLEHILARQPPQALAPLRALGHPGQLLGGCRGRRILRAAGVAEVGMLAVEDRARLAPRVL